MPSLDNLRSRKNKPTNFTPSKAYWLSGHGSESSVGKTFTVPPECVIVVKVTPGELSLLYSENEKKLFTMDKEKLKDPLKYSNYLIDNFGSVAIFKPGDQCPEFSYSLLACFPSESTATSKKHSMCLNFGSGLIDIDKITSDKTDILPIPQDVDIFTYFTNLYKNSIYPMPQIIERYCTALKKVDIPGWDNYSQVDKLNLIYQIASDGIRVTQSDLCTQVGPGVYYNFICRYRGQATNNIYTNNIITNNHGVSHLALKGLGFSEIQGQNKEKNIRLIQNRIGEAETRRKFYLKKYNSSPEFARKQENLKWQANLNELERQDEIKKAIITEKTLLDKVWFESLSDAQAFIDKLFNWKGAIPLDTLLNYEDPTYRVTPLHAALLYPSKKEFIKPLILLGAKTDVVDKQGQTLSQVAEKTSPDVLAELQKYLSKTPKELQDLKEYYAEQIKIKEGKKTEVITETTLWNKAMFKGADEILKFVNTLFDYKGDIPLDTLLNYKDPHYEVTPLGATLLFASKKEVIKPLILLGAKTDVVDGVGKTLSQIAEKTSPDVLAELQKYLSKTPEELQELKAQYIKDLKGPGPARNRVVNENWLNKTRRLKGLGASKAAEAARQLNAERKAEAARQLNAERKAEAARQEAEAARQLNAERKAEAARQEAEAARQLNAERKAEDARLKAEDARKKANAARQKAEAEKQEEARKEANRKAEEARLKAEEAERKAEDARRKADANAAATKLKHDTNTAAEKEEQISKLLSYYDISAAQKDALRIKLDSFTIEQIKTKIQKFLDKNAQVAANLAAKEKKKGILGFFGLGRTRRRTRKN